MEVRGNNNNNNNSTEQDITTGVVVSTEGAVDKRLVGVTMALCGALNTGMRENPNLTAFVPVSAKGQERVVQEWLKLGVDRVKLAEVIYETAKEFLPTERSKQINSLRYFGPVALGMVNGVEPPRSLRALEEGDLGDD